MWLLDTSTLKLHFFQDTDVPKYAILSHTWGDHEVSFQDMQGVTDQIIQKRGFEKVRAFCAQVKELGYLYAWADTACIDKRSSAELSEAINSMYRWYSQASLCVIYLDDVRIHCDVTDWQKTLKSNLRRSRWFTRGWTLQELLACQRRKFCDATWQELTEETLGEPVLDLCSSITNIGIVFLTHWHADNQRTPTPRGYVRPCIAEKMSWAARRRTSRAEDAAYCLMGIFGVSMPILYGEGLEAAFRRLQIEIMQRSTDQTLFLWTASKGTRSGLLARSPGDFKNMSGMVHQSNNKSLFPYSLSNVGIPISMRFATPKMASPAFAILDCYLHTKDGWRVPLLRLQRAQDVKCYVNGEWRPAYCRVHTDGWEFIASDHERVTNPWFFDVVVLQDQDMISDIEALTDPNTGDAPAEEGLSRSSSLRAKARKILENASYGDTRK